MKKRSKYRPKGVRLDNMTWLKAGFAKVGSLPKAGVELKIKNHEALDSIMMGQATRDHIDVLIAAFNMAEAMYKINPKLGLDWAKEIKECQDAILSLSRRYIKTGRIVFTAPEMMTVRQGMDIHDAQLDECSVKEMEFSLDLVNKTILNKQARVIHENI